MSALYNKGMKDIFDILYATAEGNTPDKPAEEKKEDVDVKKLRDKFYEIYFYQVKLRDGLLGEFSSDGKYSIKDTKILEALLSLPKHLDLKENNIVYASTKVGNHVLNFEIDLDIVETYCTATIRIVETERRAEESIVHKQEIGKLVEMYSPMFEQNALLEWNVLKEPVEIGNDNLFFKLFADFEREENMYKELFDIWAQIYLLKYLDMLDAFGENGFEVKAGYRSIYEKLFEKFPGIAQDYTRLKLILDGLMLKYPGLLESILASSPEVIRSYIESLNRARGIDVIRRVEPRDTLEPKKPDAKKKEETKAKKKPAKKKDAGKGGKGKGDKDKPKKDDKKKGGGGVLLAPPRENAKIDSFRRESEPVDVNPLHKGTKIPVMNRKPETEENQSHAKPIILDSDEDDEEMEVKIVDLEDENDQIINEESEEKEKVLGEESDRFVDEESEEKEKEINKDSDKEIEREMDNEEGLSIGG